MVDRCPISEAGVRILWGKVAIMQLARTDPFPAVLPAAPVADCLVAVLSEGLGFRIPYLTKLLAFSDLLNPQPRRAKNPLRLARSQRQETAVITLNLRC